MSKKNFLFQKKPDDPGSLFDFLKQKVVIEKKIRFSDQLLQDYILDGFVRVDDELSKKPLSFVKLGQSVSIVIKIKDMKSVQKPPKVEFELKFEDILFEDKHIIIVQKPYGVPTHTTFDPDRDNLFAALKRYLLTRDGVVPYLALHHRLDKDTSGLIMLAKKQTVNKALSDMFAERKIEKSYVAVVLNKKEKPDAWVIENQLLRSTRDTKIMNSVSEGGDVAHTEFKVLKKNKEHMMVLAQPKTGRTHQIRVHLFEDHLPILGDVFYHEHGSENFDRLYLHAWKLKFPHPVSKQPLVIESKLPMSFENFFKD